MCDLFTAFYSAGWSVYGPNKQYFLTVLRKGFCRSAIFLLHLKSNRIVLPPVKTGIIPQKSNLLKTKALLHIQ